MKAIYLFFLFVLLSLCPLAHAESSFSDSPSGHLTSLPPAQPELSLPTNGSTHNPVTVELSWKVLSHAAAYRLQVSAKPDFSTMTIDQSGITQNRFSAGGLANKTLYYWRVLGDNRAGNGPFSTVWSFTTLPAVTIPPTLSMPQDGAKDVSLDAMFAWLAVDNADSYHLQVSMKLDFSEIIIDKPNIVGTWYQHEKLPPATTLFWHVRAINAGGAGDFSNTWSFATIVTAPEPPILVSPDDNSTVGPVVDLKWNVSLGASSYNLQVADNEQFAAPAVDQVGLTATWFALPNLGISKTYYWRVNAVNAGGESGWSIKRNFHYLTTTVSEQADALPVDFSLAPAFPNPFNGGVTISWQLPQSAFVKLTIYSAAGRKVRSLATGMQSAGSHSIAWDGRDDENLLVGSGLYFCRFEAVGRVFTEKLSLIR